MSRILYPVHLLQLDDPTFDDVFLKTSASLIIDEYPFACGASRSVHRAALIFGPDPTDSEICSADLDFVVKFLLPTSKCERHETHTDSAAIRAHHLLDARMQALAARFAAAFNAAGPPRRVSYLDCAVVQLDHPGRRVVLPNSLATTATPPPRLQRRMSGDRAEPPPAVVEPGPKPQPVSTWGFIEPGVEGTYVKWNNNVDYVRESDPAATPQAFSHFSWVASRHSVMVVDVQGVDAAATVTARRALAHRHQRGYTPFETPPRAARDDSAAAPLLSSPPTHPTPQTVPLGSPAHTVRVEHSFATVGRDLDAVRVMANRPAEGPPGSFAWSAASAAGLRGSVAMTTAPSTASGIPSDDPAARMATGSFSASALPPATGWPAPPQLRAYAPAVVGGSARAVCPPPPAAVAPTDSHATAPAALGDSLNVGASGVGDQPVRLQRALGYVFTDPQLHSVGRRWGVGDFGLEGVELFFAQHVCNSVCRHLGLPRHRGEDALVRSMRSAASDDEDGTSCSSDRTTPPPEVSSASDDDYSVVPPPGAPPGANPYAQPPPPSGADATCGVGALASIGITVSAATTAGAASPSGHSGAGAPGRAPAALDSRHVSFTSGGDVAPSPAVMARSSPSDAHGSRYADYDGVPSTSPSPMASALTPAGQQYSTQTPPSCGHPPAPSSAALRTLAKHVALARTHVGGVGGHAAEALTAPSTAEPLTTVAAVAAERAVAVEVVRRRGESASLAPGGAPWARAGQWSVYTTRPVDGPLSVSLGVWYSRVGVSAAQRAKRAAASLAAAEDAAAAAAAGSAGGPSPPQPLGSDGATRCAPSVTIEGIIRGPNVAHLFPIAPQPGGHTWHAGGGGGRWMVGGYATNGHTVTVVPACGVRFAEETDAMSPLSVPRRGLAAAHEWTPHGSDSSATTPSGTTPVAPIGAAFPHVPVDPPPLALRSASSDGSAHVPTDPTAAHVAGPGPSPYLVGGTGAAGGGRPAIGGIPDGGVGAARVGGPRLAAAASATARSADGRAFGGRAASAPQGALPFVRAFSSVFTSPPPPSSSDVDSAVPNVRPVLSDVGAPDTDVVVFGDDTIAFAAADGGADALASPCVAPQAQQPETSASAVAATNPFAPAATGVVTYLPPPTDTLARDNSPPPARPIGVNALRTLPQRPVVLPPQDPIPYPTHPHPLPAESDASAPVAAPSAYNPSPQAAQARSDGLSPATLAALVGAVPRHAPPPPPPVCAPPQLTPIAFVNDSIPLPVAPHGPTGVLAAVSPSSEALTAAGDVWFSPLAHYAAAVAAVGALGDGDGGYVSRFVARTTDRLCARARQHLQYGARAQLGGVLLGVAVGTEGAFGAPKVTGGAVVGVAAAASPAAMDALDDWADAADASGGAWRVGDAKSCPTLLGAAMGGLRRARDSAAMAEAEAVRALECPVLICGAARHSRGIGRQAPTGVLSSRASAGAPSRALSQDTPHTGASGDGLVCADASAACTGLGSPVELARRALSTDAPASTMSVHQAPSWVISPSVGDAAPPDILSPADVTPAYLRAHTFPALTADAPALAPAGSCPPLAAPIPGPSPAPAGGSHAGPGRAAFAPIPPPIDRALDSGTAAGDVPRRPAAILAVGYDTSCIATVDDNGAVAVWRRGLPHAQRRGDRAAAHAPPLATDAPPAWRVERRMRHSGAAAVAVIDGTVYTAGGGPDGRDLSIRRWDGRSHTAPDGYALLLGHTAPVTMLRAGPSVAAVAAAAASAVAALATARGSDDVAADAGATTALGAALRTVDAVAIASSRRSGADLWSACNANTARRWCARTGVCLSVLRGHTSIILNLAFLPLSAVAVAAWGSHGTRRASVGSLHAAAAPTGRRASIGPGADDTRHRKGRRARNDADLLRDALGPTGAWQYDSHAPTAAATAVLDAGGLPYEVWTLAADATVRRAVVGVGGTAPPSRAARGGGDDGSEGATLICEYTVDDEATSAAVDATGAVLVAVRGHGVGVVERTGYQS